mmetsp:Transcript_65936/g.137696  ORF Transcript_65936/g.137696 Transcript_65936/m.137696 type:complete len:102 (+) Transcript_65936:240-545(+)
MTESKLPIFLGLDGVDLRGLADRGPESQEPFAMRGVTGFEEPLPAPTAPTPTAPALLCGVISAGAAVVALVAVVVGDILRPFPGPNAVGAVEGVAMPPPLL